MSRLHWKHLVPALVLVAGYGVLAAPGGSASAAQRAAARPPRGYTIVSSGTIVAPAGEQTRGTVSCPIGLVPLSGSAAIHSVSLGASVNSTFPLGTDWIADVNNAGASDVTFDVDVVCARQPRIYTVVTSPLLHSPSGTDALGVAICPRGTKPLGGGVSNASFSVFASINTTIPAGPDWIVDVTNSSPDEADFAVHAVCGHVAGYTVTTGDLVQNPAGSHAVSFATCPAPTVPIGGGAGSSTANIAVNIGGMGIAGSDFVSSMNNADVANHTTSTTAVCAGR
jgi:hypothetical protein